MLVHKRIAGGLVSFVLSSASCVIALGCGPADGSPLGENEGLESDEVRIELTNAPSGIQCIKITAQPPTGAAIVKTFTATVGMSTASLSMGRLPLGVTSFVGNAYSVACTDPNFATAEVLWTSGSASATLSAGIATTVALTFRPVNVVTASANFVGNLVGVSAGTQSTFLIMSDGTVRVSGTGSDVPTLDPQYTSVAEVATGTADTFRCARRTDGTVACAGVNTFGQTGTGSGAPAIPTLTTCPGVSGAKQLAVGANHACVRTSGNLYCWGLNSSGQVGTGVPGNSISPVPLGGFDWVATGSNHTCAINRGLVSCTGENGSGQLGINSTADQNTMQQIPTTSITGAVAVVAGAAHSCALLDNKTVKCWGDNTYGQLGNGTLGTSPRSLFPVTVSSLTDAVELSSTDNTICARRSTSGVSCWGSGIGGEVGDGNAVDKGVPTAVSGLTGVTSMDSGAVGHTCAMKPDFSVWCWGLNTTGQLGIGGFTEAFVPVAMVMQ